MTRTLIMAALAALTTLGSAPSAPAVGAPLEAWSSHRYRVVREPSRTTEVRVVKSGGTWFSGTLLPMGVNGGGVARSAGGLPPFLAQWERMTFVFLPRFATVERGNTRVPVSYLRPGDRVEVAARGTGHRLAASSARMTQPRTAKAELVGATVSCCGEACCSGACCTNACRTACGGGSCASCQDSCCGTACTVAAGIAGATGCCS